MNCPSGAMKLFFKSAIPTMTPLWSAPPKKTQHPLLLPTDFVTRQLPKALWHFIMRFSGFAFGHWKVRLSLVKGHQNLGVYKSAWFADFCDQAILELP